MRALTEKYADVPAAELTFELDFSSNRSIYSSDLLITDWSAIAYEFCFSTKRPVLFVNTKIKMENPDYRDIPDIPVEISLRDEVGRSLEKQELADSVEKMIERGDAVSHRAGRDDRRPRRVGEADHRPAAPAPVQLRAERRTRRDLYPDPSARHPDRPQAGGGNRAQGKIKGTAVPTADRNRT